MKKIQLTLLGVALLFALTQCNNASPDKITSDADSRAKTISALINNDAYMSQVMDSMRTKHTDAIFSSVFLIAKSNKEVQNKMMDKMTEMCKMDTAMTKMVVGKTMDMLDESKLGCCETGKMMMGDGTAMQHGDQADCCKKGTMIMGKTGEMSAADKLACCMAASKKPTSNVKL